MFGCLRRKLSIYRENRLFAAGYEAISFKNMSRLVWVHRDQLKSWGYENAKELLGAIDGFYIMAALQNERLREDYSEYNKRRNSYYKISTAHPGDQFHIEIIMRINKDGIIERLEAGLDLWTQIDSDVASKYQNSVHRQIDTVVNLLDEFPE